jgi:hypothetical protein
MVSQRMSGVGRDLRWPVGGPRLSQDLGAEAEITSSSVLTDVPRHMWPPVIPCNQLESFPPSRVPSNVTVMVKHYYLSSNVGSGGNIDFTAEV